jgi:hypothetical protein
VILDGRVSSVTSRFVIWIAIPVKDIARNPVNAGTVTSKLFIALNR